MTWTLDGFEGQYDDWVERDQPPVEWRIAVLEWIHALQDGPAPWPYDAARPHPTMGEPIWFYVILGAGDATHGVVCEYRVDRTLAELRCSRIHTLRRPITP